MDGPAIRQWLTALDHLSFYELFRVSPHASFDDLRHGFHAFAEIFHPDVHAWRPEGERAAIGYIFRRGTEAYRVLSDPQLRGRYDEALANGILRPEQLIVEAESGPGSLRPPAAQSLRLVDRVKNPGARPFVLRAEELLKKGDPKQAKIQLVMAAHGQGQRRARGVREGARRGGEEAGRRGQEGVDERLTGARPQGLSGPPERANVAPIR